MLTDYDFRVVDDGINRVYDATGLATDSKYDFKVIGRILSAKAPKAKWRP